MPHIGERHLVSPSMKFIQVPQEGSQPIRPTTQLARAFFGIDAPALLNLWSTTLSIAPSSVNFSRRQVGLPEGMYHLSPFSPGILRLPACWRTTAQNMHQNQPCETLHSINFPSQETQHCRLAIVKCATQVNMTSYAHSVSLQNRLQRPHPSLHPKISSILRPSLVRTATVALLGSCYLW